MTAPRGNSLIITTVSLELTERQAYDLADLIRKAGLEKLATDIERQLEEN